MKHKTFVLDDLDLDTATVHRTNFEWNINKLKKNRYR